MRNAFCAIRPPGHHAGPTGVVACANDPTGSHGFCLLNNLAVAAAYAMNAHRHAGEQAPCILVCVSAETVAPQSKFVPLLSMIPLEGMASGFCLLSIFAIAAAYTMNAH